MVPRRSMLVKRREPTHEQWAIFDLLIVVHKAHHKHDPSESFHIATVRANVDSVIMRGSSLQRH